ncbi:GDYXXLXY domain-containing protein [Roseateles oligotrophus]|uniref:GDYXXLXY domain-containing protein n=1 Tax=Roseateles oligotrophus TaxID=1769250 RepID=A0ABT2YI52_9BURK|nr:GDYXXLXY domain-containing protein [Roseateles oligotrophus]MCV2369755.1 GDYXXLXY domain-containing protein [Roseateles oligotrophus]
MKRGSQALAPAQLLQRAITAGLLPGSATLSAAEARPWSLLLLTALGAWLAAVPLLSFIYLLLGPSLTAGGASYLVGALVLLAAAVILRSNSAPLFLEQLAMPLLLSGALTLSLGLYRDLHHSAASVGMLIGCLGLALAIDKAWLRILLGAAAGLFFCLALMPTGLDERKGLGVHWLILHGGMVIGLAALLLQQRFLLHGRQAAKAALLEALATGWLLMLVLGLAALGSVAALEQGLFGPESSLPSSLRWAYQAGAVVFALGGFALAAQAWPDLRRPLPLAVALVLAGLCAWLPCLGGLLMLLAWGSATRRRELAMASAMASVWVLGASYYQLSWTLSSKAGVLAGAAALLAPIAWLAASRQGQTPAGASPAPRPKRMPGAACLLGGGLLALLLVNAGIWQKQRLISEGRPIFVALAPIDPRSLMQGDFMRLNYDLGPDVNAAQLHRLGAARTLVVLGVDARGLALLRRVHEQGKPLAADEQLIALSPRNGGWTLVSDAWYFREGDGKRWQAAKYGEFRVRPDGQALLVGLADAKLRPIQP